MHKALLCKCLYETLNLRDIWLMWCESLNYYFFSNISSVVGQCQLMNDFVLLNLPRANYTDSLILELMGLVVVAEGAN